MAILVLAWIALGSLSFGYLCKANIPERYEGAVITAWVLVYFGVPLLLVGASQ